MKESKFFGIFVIVLIYFLAGFLGIYVFQSLEDQNIFVRLFAADVAATILVWFFSVIFQNSSIYDPYWSVLPIVMFMLLIYHENSYKLETMLLFIPIALWAVRLTTNWALMFENLRNQDWRYDKYKEDFPKLWPLINFTGIQLMPTLIVFMAIIPGIVIITASRQGVGLSWNVFTILAMFVSILAPVIQLIADVQRYRFSKKNYGKVCNIGLWKYSRHPNYFGEILMWWGIYLMLLSMNISFWWTGIGALLNNLLFLFISIPLMEKRQLKNKPEYSDYVRKTGKLIPRIKRT